MIWRRRNFTASLRISATWPGSVRRGPSQCDVAWLSATWPGSVRRGLAQCDVAWLSATWPGSVRRGLTQCDVAWLSATWPGSVRRGLAQCDVAWLSATWSVSVITHYTMRLSPLHSIVAIPIHPYLTPRHSNTRHNHPSTYQSYSPNKNCFKYHSSRVRSLPGIP